MTVGKSGKIRVGLVGATGYTGMELARILVAHPFMSLERATSRKENGRSLAELHPFLLGTAAGKLPVTGADPEDLARSCDLVFLALPHGASMSVAADMLRRGLRVVDLSADFRLRDPKVYEVWYKTEHGETGLLLEAVYGLPELHGAELGAARLAANPGCYPTGAVLGLYPVLKNAVVDESSLIIDAKSGVSGAGREARVGSLFCEVSDNFKAYSLAAHRHTPEIEQELSCIAGRPLTVSFSPHLLPVNRGILSTLYAGLKDRNMPLREIRSLYVEAYAGHEFVRLLPEGVLPDLRSVRGSMYCDIGLVKDERAGRLIIVTCIDNLCRGASGQAVACANLMCGLPPGAGLCLIPSAP
ncbi:MAG: N-acetyl-gamma-glutamyl-phosphate reductase [Desulfovibrio sp.]|jgi:N-acetyl-gamma-glutamyl-phosphate reductase|nr:N-acetyl-gamma-glutamyl-phosphate reductase [Desulfovibrio sp.]